MGFSCPNSVQAGPIAAGFLTTVILASAVATFVSIITAEVAPLAGEACRRKCEVGDTKSCKFNFIVQPYQTISRACHDCPKNASNCELEECVVGDGIRKFLYVVNKKLPGPHIDVCEGDTVIVEVHNELPAAGISLHWHGLTHHENINGPATPFMDGVPGITQCDIPARGRFTYKFVASNPGTHWWHSHSGFQRGDGMFGPLIVKKPLIYEPNNHLYDYDLPEHVIMIHDWIHKSTEEKFALRHFGGEDDFPNNILVNGHGVSKYIDPEYKAATESLKSLPYSRFHLLAGKRYRLRLISAAILNCPINVYFEGHPMTIITSDGNDVVPFNTSSLVIQPGQRYDVVVTGHYAGLYWMNFMGLVDCAETYTHQFGLIQVHDNSTYHKYTQVKNYHVTDDLPIKTPSYTAQKPAGIQLGSVNSGCKGSDEVCEDGLRSITPLPEDAKSPKADSTYYFAFTMRQVHNRHFYDRILYDIESFPEDDRIPSPQVNNITSMLPFEPLLMGSSEPKDSCNSDSSPSQKMCKEEFCECLHLIKVPLGHVVDVVLIDEGPHSDEGHPVHMHGMKFWVLAQDRPNDVDDANITRYQVMEMDKQGQLHRNLENPVMKDTVHVPDAGYTIIRFKADNPGYWLMHCHLIFHSVAGMAVVIQVGDHSQFPSPPANFPTCSNFMNT